MTKFDQQGQHASNQYNAGHDIAIRRGSLPLEEKKRLNNRARMLERIQALCIDGVLEPLLHEVAEISIQVEKKPSAIITPMWNIFREFDKTGPLHANPFSIVHVFDHANGELLILGEPGAGKSTLLLQLTRELLLRAQKDDMYPIPVPLNLMSWATTRQPLAEWIIDQLDSRYQVPLAIAKAWTEEDLVLPLLDGLDEVMLVHRADCVATINMYRSTHGLVPTVVCSRLNEYMALASHLRLRMAVIVQPLTAQQIESYLVSGGARLAALRAMLGADADLYALARTPLMLNILTHAYQDIAQEDIPAHDASSQAQRREQIFAFYVERMLARRSSMAPYTPQQTLHWLCFLAQQMKRHNQNIFHLEQMQPTWLTGLSLLRVYERWAIHAPAILVGMLVGLVTNIIVNTNPPPALLLMSILFGGLFGNVFSATCTIQLPTTSKSKISRSPWLCRLQQLLVGIGMGLASWCSFGWQDGWGMGLSVGLASTLFQMLLRNKEKVRSQSQPPLVRPAFWRNLMNSHVAYNGVLAFVLVGLSVGLNLSWNPRLGAFMTTWLRGELNLIQQAGLDAALHAGLINIGQSYGLNFALSSMLSVMLSSFLLVGKSGLIQPIEVLDWSWGSLGRALIAGAHLRMTLIVTLLIGLSTALGAPPVAMVADGLGFGLSIGLSYWLLLGIIQSVTSQAIQAEQRLAPNEGIRYSGSNGLTLGIASTLIAGLFIGLGIMIRAQLLIGPMLDLAPILTISLVAGLSVGLLIGLFNGGIAWVRHFLLRRLLIHFGAIPHGYPAFLDDSVERILLR